MERTHRPTAARLEAVDLLQGPLRPAALNPAASVSPTEPALPLGRARGRAWAVGVGGQSAEQGTARSTPAQPGMVSGAAGAVQARALLHAVPWNQKPYTHTSTLVGIYLQDYGFGPAFCSEEEFTKRGV